MTVNLADLHQEFSGPTLAVFSYRSGSNGAKLLTDGYWDPAAGRLAVGDRIFCTCTGGKANAHFTLAVSYRHKGVVKVAVEGPPAD